MTLDAPVSAASSPHSALQSALARLRDALQGEDPGLRQSRELLPRSAALEELEAPGAARRLMWLGVALTAGFGLWSCLLQLDEVAAAPGLIAPAAHVQPVQHRDGGIVSHIHALDGQPVRQGDLLVSLEDADAKAALQQLRAREAALRLRAERLSAFADARPARWTDSAYAGLDQEARSLLEQQQRSRAARLATLDAQAAQRDGETAALAERRASLTKQLALLDQDLNARKPLVEKGLISRLAYLTLERERERLQGALAETLSQLTQAQAARAEIDRQRAQALQGLRTDALAERAAVSAELAEVEEMLRSREAEVERLQVRAPVDGVVTGLAAIAPGQVLAPGATLAQVVPRAGPLLAEVRVSPADVGYVKVGSPALVKVATYDFSRFGGIEGSVRYVSAASFVDEAGKPYFKARIELAQTHVGPPEQGMRVSPGMTLTADIKTGSKTLADYLFRPVGKAFAGAFHER